MVQTWRSERRATAQKGEESDLQNKGDAEDRTWQRACAAGITNACSATEIRLRSMSWLWMRDCANPPLPRDKLSRGRWSGVSPAWADISHSCIAKSCAFPCRAGGVFGPLPGGLPRLETACQTVEDSTRAGFEPNVEMWDGLRSWVYKNTMQRAGCDHGFTIVNASPVEANCKPNDGKV